LLYSLALGCAEEYFQATSILAPFFLTPMFFDTTSILTVVHLESNGYFLFFLKDYEPNQIFKLSSDSFKLAFQHKPHLLISGSSGMVFEYLQDCFHPKDSTNGFL